MLLQTADETDLTDEVYAEHDSMKDREEVEIEKAATTTSTLLYVTLYRHSPLITGKNPCTFNAIPDTNHNANPTNPNRYSD